MKSDKSIIRLIYEGCEKIKNKLSDYEKDLNHRLRYETITIEDKRNLINQEIKKVQDSLERYNRNPSIHGFHKEISRYYKDINGLYQYLKNNRNDIILLKECDSKIFLTFYPYEKLQFLAQVKESIGYEETGSQPDRKLNLETEQIIDWIYQNHLSEFSEIEKELFLRGFIDENYKWQKTKKELIDFITVIMEYRFFKQIVEGNSKQSFHYRRFISERYGYGPKGLSESCKKYKPDIKTALIPFFWINKPE